MSSIRCRPVPDTGFPKRAGQTLLERLARTAPRHGQRQVTRKPYNSNWEIPCGVSSERNKYLTEVIKRLPHNATVKQAAALTPARFAAGLAAVTAQAEAVA